MRALSVREPWASLIRDQIKTIELRSWTTKHRGPLLICSGSNIYRGKSEILAPADAVERAFARSRGVAVCIVELVDVRPATARDAQAACCEPDLDREFAWVLSDPQPVPAVPISGRLGLMTLDWAAILQSFPVQQAPGLLSASPQ
jgi:hypothetical protein